MKRNVLLILAACLLLAACASGDSGDVAPAASELSEAAEPPADNSAPPAPAQKEPQTPPEPGGTIKTACRPPKTFNPILNEDLTVDKVLRLIYEPLVALDESMKPAPAIADSWDFSSDGMTLTLRLHPQAQWADGTPVTARDVLFTFDTIKNSPATALYHSCLANIAAYTAPDASTVQISYTKAFSGALYQLTLPVIPAHFFSGEGADGYWPLGSGQYQLVEHHRMRALRLSASANSYRGRPQIDAVEATIVRETSSAYYAYEQRLIDIVDAGREDWEQIVATRSAGQKHYPSLGYEFLAINYRNPILQNVAIRKAIAYCLDKEVITERCYDGNAVVAHTPANPFSWLYAPGTDFIEFDVGFAAEMLAGAGESFAEGFSLTVLVNNDNTARMEAAALLQQELAKINIQANVVTDANFENYLRRLQNGDFDLAFCGVDMTLAPDLVPVLGSGGGYNFGGYKNAVMDQYLSQANASVTEPSIHAAFTNIQKQFNQDLPHISIAYKTNVLLVSETVYGETAPQVNNPYANVGRLRIAH